MVVSQEPAVSNVNRARVSLRFVELRLQSGDVSARPTTHGSYASILPLKNDSMPALAIDGFSRQRRTEYGYQCDPNGT